MHIFCSWTRDWTISLTYSWFKMIFWGSFGYVRQNQQHQRSHVEYWCSGSHPMVVLSGSLRTKDPTSKVSSLEGRLKSYVLLTISQQPIIHGKMSLLNAFERGETGHFGFIKRVVISTSKMWERPVLELATLFWFARQSLEATNFNSNCKFHAKLFQWIPLG